MEALPFQRGFSTVVAWKFDFLQDSYYCFSVEMAVDLLDLVRYRFSVACVQELGSKGVDTQPEPAAVKANQLVD